MLDHFVFLDANKDLSAVIPAQYDMSLVLLSISLAIFSSYLAFFVSKRIHQPQQQNFNSVWLCIGSLALGSGIWAMHFIGMLAYTLPIDIHYDPVNTMISVIPAIGASIVVLQTSDLKGPISIYSMFLRSVLVGAGIGLMHYIGMTAMHVNGSMQYDPKIFIVSIIVAIILAGIALHFKLQADKHTVDNIGLYKKLLFPALIMGCAISAMHYTGMASVYIFPGASHDVVIAVWKPIELVKFISGITVLLGALLLIAIEVAYRFDLHNKIKQSERYLAITLNSIGDAVITTDTTGKITQMNPVAEKLTGWLLETAKGKLLKDIFSIIDASTRLPIESPIEKVMATGEIIYLSNHTVLVAKNGTEYHIADSAAPIREDDGGRIFGMILVFNDVTEYKLQQEKILHQAHFDALTDLPNRFLSLDRLSQLINDAERNNKLVAILFLDLDDFKKINDSLGHDVGDKLLIEASARLHKGMRKGDTVGRLGGDEFIILLGDLNYATDVRPVVESLLERFRKPFNIDGRELMLTTSVGISIYPSDGVTSSKLLRNADLAMYYAKEQGRNTYSYFTTEMNKNVSRRLALEQQMHNALEKNEFTVNYQPKIDIASGNMTGVEALLRWNNPTLGQIPPDQFIPVAEQTGLIIAISEFVLKTALKATKNWIQIYGDTFTVAVNLSPRQFRDPNLVNFIEQALLQAGLTGDALELEITEGVLMNGDANIHEALAEISALGINIAMDDFGTGYSSLNYLRKYPFDVLKIDHSFISDITENDTDRELVNATIAMAHSLGLKVVAEGVETKEQLALLASQGCEIAQGYLFSKAVTADEITAMLTNKKV